MRGYFFEPKYNIGRDKLISLVDCRAVHYMDTKYDKSDFNMVLVYSNGDEAVLQYESEALRGSDFHRLLVQVGLK